MILKISIALWLGLLAWCLVGIVVYLNTNPYAQ